MAKKPDERNGSTDIDPTDLRTEGEAVDIHFQRDQETSLQKDKIKDYGRKERHLGQAPKNLKDSPEAQFEYGRRTEKETERYDQSSKRLEHGNPDIGNVDMGLIDRDRPLMPDDRPESE